jgi:hypothetical protein
LSVTANSTQQLVAVQNNGVAVGTRQVVNFIPGTNITVTTADDSANGRANVTVGISGFIGAANGGLGANVSPGTTGNTIFTTDGSTWSSTQKIVQSTAVTLTTQTAVDFTSIPSWVKRIVVMFDGASLSGTSDILVRLGTSGGIVSTGYVSGCTATTGTSGATSTSTTGFVIRLVANASACYGIMTIALISTNKFVSAISGRQDSTANIMGGGSVALGGTLTQIRITTVNGTDTFDAGSVNILYE